MKGCAMHRETSWRVVGANYAPTLIRDRAAHHGLPLTQNAEVRYTSGPMKRKPPQTDYLEHDQKALEELAATFKTQGVLEPLLVRELEERAYPVVIGGRRLRAAKIAELDAVPVQVVKLSDAEAIEAQVVDLSVVCKCFLRS